MRRLPRLLVVLLVAMAMPAIAAPHQLISSAAGWQRVSKPSTAFSSGSLQMSADRRYLCYLVKTKVGSATVTEAARQDLKTGKVVTVSESDRTNHPADADVTAISMSADGRMVAFATGADNLVPHDTNKVTDVFVRDIVKSTTTRVSVGLRRAQLPSGGDQPQISSDGSTAFFTSKDNIFKLPETSGGSESLPHLYATTLKTGRLDLVSGASGHLGDVFFGYSVSRTGRYVAFESGSKLSSAATAPADIYLKDRQTGSLALVTGKFDTATTEGYLSLSMDASATWLVFQYSDTSDFYDEYYVANLHTGTFTAIDGGSPVSTVEPTSNGSVNQAGTEVVYSGGGAGVTQQPTTAAAVEGTTWYVRNLQSGVVHTIPQQVSSSQWTQCPGGLSEFGAVLSPDGTRLLDLTSYPLTSGDTDCGFDLYEATVG